MPRRLRDTELGGHILRHDRLGADPRERWLRHERMKRGRGVVPLDEAQLRGAIARLLAMDCESLLIHFLHAYANPAHELRAGEIARQLWPNDYVTLGHQLLSEFREYERGTTASVNAAVQPILDRYVRRLQGELHPVAAGGHAHRVRVPHASGDCPRRAG
jgi:N-methylhydantoinase A